MLGNRVLILTAWLHSALGNTLSQILEVIQFYLQLRLTPGGLIHMWHRPSDILHTWHEQLQQEALKSAVTGKKQDNPITSGDKKEADGNHGPRVLTIEGRRSVPETAKKQVGEHRIN